MPITADEFLSSSLLPEEGSKEANIHSIHQAERTVKKDYRAAYIYINVTSYSQRTVLHECPRKYQILKLPQAGGGFNGLTNLDFIFGHAVGAGIQTYLVTRNKQAALFATFLAWNTDLYAEIPKKGKGFWQASIAVEKFCNWWEQGYAGTWELASFNGRPATELTFFLDTENGYYHAGHIDAVLKNRITGRYLVLEVKTTAIRDVDEAQYGNSEQPLGYSLILDKITEDLNEAATFEVLYLVYSSTRRELISMPFTKHRSERAEWLQDLLLDHTIIGTYKKLSLFPKRGDACWSFNHRCPHYGMCDLATFKKNFEFKIFDRSTMPLPEPVDFEFRLSDMTSAILRDKIDVVPQV